MILDILKSNFNKIVLITAIYVLISWFIVVYNHVLLFSYYSLGPAELYSLSTFFIVNTLIGLIAGILGGSLLVVINSRLFRKKSFGYAMIATLISYTAIFVIIVVVVPFASQMIKLNDIEDIKFLLLVLFDNPGVTLTSFCLWLFITLATLFFLQINDKFGPGILGKFIVGKYHQAREEDRIFMFMDMRSSTTIAEKLGSKKYFNMLQDVFFEITDAIIKHKGEIYQYVGDEIIITWKANKTNSDKDFIECFKSVQEMLMNSKDRYEKSYGVHPEFKAGVHVGTVTAGEIGSIKKDIVYSGDVLNTASRIQGQCNDFKVNLLVSEQAMQYANMEKNYISKNLGEIELKGKDERITILSPQF